MDGLRLVAVGTGRCGTAYVAHLLTSAGLLCGHEYFFSFPGLKEAQRRLRQERHPYVGDSSWLAVPFLDSPPLGEALVVHVTRHPKKMIESTLRSPPHATPPYDAFCHRHLPMLHAYDRLVDKCALRYAAWNEWIEGQCSGGRAYVRYRIEDGPMALFELMRQVGAIKVLPREKNLFADTRVNHKEGRHVEADPDGISPMLRARLRAAALRYGYDWPGAA